MFSNILTCDDWNKPIYSYRAKLQEELDATYHNFKNAINEDITMTTKGWAFITRMLGKTVSFI